VQGHPPPGGIPAQKPFLLAQSRAQLWEAYSFLLLVLSGLGVCSDGPGKLLQCLYRWAHWTKRNPTIQLQVLRALQALQTLYSGISLLLNTSSPPLNSRVDLPKPQLKQYAVSNSFYLSTGMRKVGFCFEMILNVISGVVRRLFIGLTTYCVPCTSLAILILIPVLSLLSLTLRGKPTDIGF